ncbi:MAG TPA: YdcF family protein [Stellaceae bacterium]|nr:YdcF family protein [Stellaceae bacterium]
MTGRRWPRALGWFVAGAATTMLLWAAGLVWFVHCSLSFAADPAQTDAIVVLTGGRLRLETGLDLLGAGRAHKLFVSGVNPHVDRLELMRVAGHADADDLTRIVIGHDADNTFGNARETAVWMQQEGYRSLRLVTSWYHMQRSLLEFERAMPQARIVAEPVFAGHEGEARWGWFDVVLLTVSEYDKYLAALIRPGIAPFWPHTGETHALNTAESAAAASRRP